MDSILVGILTGLGAWIALRSDRPWPKRAGVVLFAGATVIGVVIAGVSTLFLVATITPTIIGILYLLDASGPVSIPP